MMSSAGGKGSGRRPQQITTQQFDNNWEAIFGKKEEKETKDTHCQNCKNCNCDKTKSS